MRAAAPQVHDFSLGALSLHRSSHGGQAELRFSGSGFGTSLKPHHTHGALRLNASADPFDEAFAYYQRSKHAAVPLIDVLRRRCCGSRAPAAESGGPPCSLAWQPSAKFPERVHTTRGELNASHQNATWRLMVARGPTRTAAKAEARCRAAISGAVDAKDLVFDVEACRGEPSNLNTTSNHSSSSLVAALRAAPVTSLVHQVWISLKGGEAPPALPAAVATNLRRLNPRMHYQLWGSTNAEVVLHAADADRCGFAARATPAGESTPESQLRAFRAGYGKWRADHLRFVLLGLIGGVYTDVDLEWLAPFDAIWAEAHQADFVSALGPFVIAPHTQPSSYTAAPSRVPRLPASRSI